MSKSHPTDIESLYSSIHENPDSYQEIVQAEDANVSLGRWPLVHAIHELDQSAESRPLNAKSFLKATLAKTKILNPLDMIRKVASPSKRAPVPEQEILPTYGHTPIPVDVKISYVDFEELNHEVPPIVEKATPQAAPKAPPSDDIKSLFARLNRS